MSALTQEEETEVQAMVVAMKPGAMAQTLEDLAVREKSLLDGPIGADPELRRLTMWNLAVLAAASELVNRAREPT